MYFIDQVDLETTTGGSVGDVFQQLTGLFHASARGGIDFNQVEEATAFYILSGWALTTGLRAYPAGFAVQTLGKNTRDRGLADPSHTGEEISVVQPVVIQRVGQCRDHVALPNQITELLWSPFSGQYLVAHIGSAIGGRVGGARTSNIPAPESAAAAAPFQA